MTDTPLAAIILAAGKGTRMKSDLHKVLHPIAGRPMLLHLIASVAELGAARTVIVTGAEREQVEAAVVALGVDVAVQAEQLGTGHAVRQAESALAGFSGDVLILYGDVPLVSADTMRRMRAALHADEPPVAVVLGFRPLEPAAYGRVIATGGRIDRMIEAKDASADDLQETLCNSGLMMIGSGDLFRLLARITNDNAAGEYYLPDVVMLALAEGGAPVVIEADPAEVLGVNSRAELAAVEASWQAERRRRAMADGATLSDPATVWFSHDTVLGRDVTVGQNVVFGPGVAVADGATIHPFCHLEGAAIGPGASVGPYARLRLGTVLGERARVGNFVETKQATLGRGAKASHLTYLGDVDVGDAANVGAGTITCNYDGFFKYRTIIGSGVFVGSNSSLVAPVVIGNGAIIGAGSTVTEDVPADALRLVRPAQSTKPGWAARFREVMTARKLG